MKLSLTNSEQKATLCRNGFALLKKMDMMDNWRLHSAGYAFHQKTVMGKIRTNYLHKLFANELISRPTSDSKLFVRMKNENKLDCRIENLEWTTMGSLRRHQHSPASHFRGVSQDGNKFRAILYDEGERIYIGRYNTAEEAALAYNNESIKRFGKTAGLNEVSIKEDGAIA
jgi:hypothetical protein